MVTTHTRITVFGSNSNARTKLYNTCVCPPFTPTTKNAAFALQQLIAFSQQYAFNASQNVAEMQQTQN
jgi:hypothetical protein